MTVAGVDGSTREDSRVRVWGEAARPFVGVLVIGLWIVWAVLAWQLEPRSVSVAQVRADITSGQIITYQVTGQAHPRKVWLPPVGGGDWDTLGLDEATGLPSDEPNQQAATGILYWVEAPFAQTRHLDLSDVRSSGLGADPSVTYEGLVTEMRAGGVPLQSPRFDALPYQDAPFWPGWAALLLGFGGVLLVYRPTRVTRWGWLWLVGGVPFGLGLVALAVAELVRPARPTPPQLDDDGEPREDRMRGGRAFLLGLVLSLLLSVTAGEISRGTTSLWIP